MPGAPTRDAATDGADAARDASAGEVVLRDAAPLDAMLARDVGALDVIHPDGDDAALQPATLSSLVETFFAPTCVLGRCHTTLAPTGDLSLTGRRVSVYETLVNAPSRGAPSRILVVPFEPEQSYLIEKLVSEQPAVGTRMPPSGGIVPPEQLARLRAWIAAGARND